jgi:hypothetical protein
VLRDLEHEPDFVAFHCGDEARVGRSQKTR